MARGACGDASGRPLDGGSARIGCRSFATTRAAAATAAAESASRVILANGGGRVPARDFSRVASVVLVRNRCCGRSVCTTRPLVQLVQSSAMKKSLVEAWQC